MAATLKMVAEAAKVSIRTAGRALSSSGPVKPEVAERVLAAARELNYVPNAAARSLKQQSSRIVGVISGASFQSECMQRRIRLLEEALREEKYHTLLGGLPGTPEELDELLRSWAGIVESVVFLAWSPKWAPEKLLTLPIRFLFIDCEIASGKFDRIETDRASGVAAAVTELIRAGRRRIMARSSSKRSAASVRASSVLPTPVGPRKMKLAIGRFGSLSPARARSTASATAETASPWPTTRSCSRPPRASSFSFSLWTSLDTGMWVQRLMIAAMSSSSTSSLSSRDSPDSLIFFSASAICFSMPGMMPCWSFAASS